MSLDDEKQRHELAAALDGLAAHATLVAGLLRRHKPVTDDCTPEFLRVGSLLPLTRVAALRNHTEAASNPLEAAAPGGPGQFPPAGPSF